MATAAEDVAYVKDRISKFSSSITAVSKAAEPAYSNAANGFFRDNLIKDPHVLDAIRPAERQLNGDAQALFDIYRNYSSEIVNAFVTSENHHSDLIEDPSLVFDIPKIVEDVVRIVGEIVAIYVADPATKATAIAALKADVQKLMEDIKNKTAILEGTNANGAISKGVNAAATKASAAIDARGWDPDIKKLADVLNASAKELAKLDTENHKPWLNPEWQVKFQGIMNSVEISLN